MRRRPPIPLAAGLLLAGACTLGPDYERPEVPRAETWRGESAPDPETLANTPWWELYDDPALVALIRIALAENRDLRIATERIEEARALYGFTRADLYPKVDAGASAALVRVTETGLPPAPPGTDVEDPLYRVGGTVFWELDVFGRIRRASEAQRALLYASEEVRRAVVLALVADVARAYVELRDFDARLAISLRTLESRREYVELARLRFEGGLTSELDWRQAEAEYHRTETLVHLFEQFVTQKENEITVLLGRTPGEIQRGAPVNEFPIPPAVPAGLPADLLDRRPDLRAAEEELASANARIGEAKALLYPSFALTGAFGWESTEIGDLLDAPSRVWSLGLDVLQPVFNAGQNRRRVEVAESRQRQALLAYEQAILQALREVEDNLVGFRQSGDRLAAQRARVAAESQVLELAELRYRGGVSDYLEVLDAQRSLFDSELEEAQALRDQLVFGIELYKALGGGWPEAPPPGPPPES